MLNLKTIEEVYQNDKKNLDFFTDSYKNNFNFEIGISKEEFPEISGERRFSPMDRSLRRELKSTFGNNNYWFNTAKFKNAVEIKIKSENEVIEFLVPKEMVSTSSVRLFVLWTTLPSLVLIIIALIFLKNQTRPLVNLLKQLKDLVRETMLMILDHLEHKKLEKQLMNLIEWQKELIVILIKDQKCYQE